MRKFINDVRQTVRDPSSQHPINQLSNRLHPKSGSGLAAESAQRAFSYFYSSQNGQFQARVKSESTLGANDHFGYVVWPVVIMVQCVAECLSSHEVKKATTALQAYWNPEKHGFCAWKMFPGNNDIYYDDNAHAAQSLVTAFEATGDKKHMEQAKQILFDLIMPSAQKDGGVPWHTNNQNFRNACSTGPAAVAALRICAIEHNPQLYAFGERALQFLVEKLRDPEDGLIWDSLGYGENGSVNVNKMKWTYNTGFAIHGFALLHGLSKNPDHLKTAVDFAEAAMNREGPLVDRSIPNLNDRMYRDGSQFLHHLIDGYAALSRYALRERLVDEIHRVAAFGREFMLDASDGLFYRGTCPYTISDDTRQRFNSKFGTDKGLEKNGQERDEQGNLCKTMIGSAGWVRILHLAQEVYSS
ncbi:Six-hairpin glycosidase [Glarea lozoyensis ATCC 20868]|uniref:Six-hairpin glycosidase n=1 Tax=Glarea lozoyensis (strain ATCC 20868 / MF5171) TaxID=1116229 RepID=S3DF19_GLAL2|nr:Six-hairpin glycosidase [Glarea lozoyensis ATCC 20868]EPE37012.1 Six-hairpin glycosidase [Glarea lozoyensis ATCC 20868]